MSRILRYKKLLVAAVIVCVFELLSILIIRNTAFSVFIAIVDGVLIMLCIMDLIAYKAMIHQMEPFNAKSKIRNVNNLIIGEKCDPKEVGVDGSSFVQIRNPGVSEEGAFQILIRTHSILKENGTVIIALASNNLGSKKLGVLDTF